MPNPTTLRDVVPILEDLRQLIKVPLVAKQDAILYKRIAWKSRCRLTPVGGKKLTPSSKKDCPLKSPGCRGQFNIVDFISGLLFSLEFSHAFSGEFDGMGGVDYAVKDSVSHSRIPHHVVPCRGRILGCDDY